MIIDKGDKVHIVYRALYEASSRRHFLGEVVANEGALCRIEGYAFVLDRKSETYVRRPEKRTTIVDLAESGYIVNVLDRSVELGSVRYKYEQNVGLVVTDEKSLKLNINEFGSKN
jgi:hypothetical protein